MSAQNCIGLIRRPHLTFESMSWSSWLQAGAWLMRREFRRWMRLPAIWSRRIHLRREMARFDGRMLSDIGVTEFEIQREIDKPFWRE